MISHCLKIWKYIDDLNCNCSQKLDGLILTLFSSLHVGQFGLVISVKCCATSLATADDSSLEILVLAKLES